MRIVSLLPSATEIVAALGFGPDLVGVSHECDHPAEVVGRPVLTAARIAPSASSPAIDAGVRDALREALSIYTVDREALALADPDVIVTQDLCEVCAVSADDVRAAAAEVCRPGLEIVTLHPTRLAHILDDVRRVGAALGAGPAAEALVRALQARIDAVAARRPPGRRPAVVTLEWLEPVMLGGTWMPELVELAGGTALAVDAGGPAPTLDRAALRALRPDVVIVKPCGFDLERTLQERDLLASLLEDTGWRAPVFLADGNAYFNRSGPRIVESLELLAACLHPERLDELAPEVRAGVVRLDVAAT